jgi:hypothetical protein
VTVFGMLRRFKVRDGNECLREWWVIVLVGLDAAFLDVKGAGLNVYFLANDFVDVFDW